GRQTSFGAARYPAREKRGCPGTQSRQAVGRATCSRPREEVRFMRTVMRTAIGSTLLLSVLAGCGTWETVERRVSVEFAPAGEAPLVVRTGNGSIKASEQPGEKIVVNAVI